MKPMIWKNVVRIDCDCEKCTPQENYICKIGKARSPDNVRNVRYITLGQKLGSKDASPTVTSMASQYGGGISLDFTQGIDCGAGEVEGSDPPVNELFCGAAPLKVKELRKVFKSKKRISKKIFIASIY